MAVVELRRRDGLAAGGGVAADRLADPFDASRDRGFVVGRDLMRLRQRLDHPVGQVVHEAHEEMPGAHRRVADPQIEQPGSGVHLRQRRRIPFLTAAGELAGGLPETGKRIIDLRAERLPDDEPGEAFRGVVLALAA